MNPSFLKLIPLCLFAVSCSSLPAVEAPPLFSTSFEEVPKGMLTEQKDGVVLWTSEGKVEVTDQYQHSGKQSLHLFGGKKNTVDLRLTPGLRDSRWLSFQAERWTSKSPFSFRVLAKVAGQWKEIADLDDKVAVGRSFTSQVLVELPEAGGMEALRWVCTAPEQAGVLMDDVALHSVKPKGIAGPTVASEKIAKLLNDEALFISGTLDTHTFRIPALITALNGDLLAVCDARRKSGADLIHVRDIDIVIRRSSDHGKTWSDMELICDFGDGRPASDPSLILDRETGEIFCFYNYMDQNDAPKEFRLYVQSSKDHGQTWGEARDITDDITLPGWKMDFKFITSGRGVQTRETGELLHTLVNLKNGMRVFGSKDHGQTWHLIDVPVQPANESKVIELADGRWMVNSRNNGRKFRWVHRSDDQGKTWVSACENQLVDPGCNGSILRYTDKADGYAKNRLIFSNANSASGRKNLSVRISYDEGDTWSEGKVIDPGPSAYSSLTICADGTIGVLYEPGYKEVRFARFTLDDLTDGQDKLSQPYKVR